MIVKPLEVETFDRTAQLVFEYAQEMKIENYDEEHIIEQLRERKIEISNCWLNAMIGQQVVGFIAGGCSEETLTKNVVGVVDFFYLQSDHNTEENIRDLLFAFIDHVEKFKGTRLIITAELAPATKHFLEEGLSLTNQNIIGRSI